MRNFFWHFQSSTNIFQAIALVFGSLDGKFIALYRENYYLHLHLPWHLQQVFQSVEHGQKHFLSVLGVTYLSVKILQKFFFPQFTNSFELVYSHKV